ncbi:hypothetical protein EW146_g3432 [Bondarzewia mesenterica]|uniref:Cytochrome P450 n=1 Tax=Bondarzewia mesenterica TaxID=1095465 RepID=A0A4S4LXV0_9AGAM|nr:hypothetical protein EW146_g3432 [Bondarzewia mesenterica]
MSQLHILPVCVSVFAIVTAEDVLYVTDPKGLRHILMKDRELIYDEPPMIIERNKLLWGFAHKKQRRILNAVFSAHRNSMDLILVFNSRADAVFWFHWQLEESLSEQLNAGSAEIDLLIWMSRTSLELIGQAGVGVSFDDLTNESPPNEYMMAAKQLMYVPFFNFLIMRSPWWFRESPLSFPLQGFMRMIPHLVKFGSPRLRGFLAGIAPHPNIRKLKQIIYFLYGTNSAVYQKRVEDLSKGHDATEAMVGMGKDVISILIRENEKVSASGKLTDDEIISNIGTLVFAGHDTTSVTLSRILHVLALDQERQQRLRQEVTRARAEGSDLSYNDLMALPYLGAVCKETLRLYAPVTQLHRVPRKDAIVPLSRFVQGKDGSFIERVTVKAGTMVVIGAAAVNRDPLIWGPDADAWRPERWLEPMPNSVAEAFLPGVYSNMMTFMGGGRSCIGFKFAETEIKVILFLLISRFNFDATDKNVVWNMYNFATPTVDGTGPPSLPMKITSVK